MSAFTLIDFVIFAICMSLSAFIGIYFACFAKKQKSETEYLYGSKKMKAIPVGLSLYSSAISAVSIIGIPVEVYSFGTAYITGVFGMILALVIIYFVILPVFCGNLNIKTPYEYFERRFDNNVKLMSSIIYIIHTLLMMPVVLLAPSLALSQMTNINVIICTTTIGGICILYTTFGGFKTVIWTDSLQASLMLLSCLLVAITGIQKAGGFSEMWNIASEGERIDFFNMNPNPFVRITFWSSIIGLAFIHTSHAGCSAGALQRYMSLPSQKDAKISTIIGAMGTGFMHIVGGLIGLAIFAVYRYCDPIESGQIISRNYLVPYFVGENINYIPGFSGFFIAGLLSAALSTLSSELNVVGGIIYYDFILKYCKNKFTLSNGLLLMKIIIVINGIIYLVGVTVIKNSKHIYELALTVGGITFGAKVGVLFLGILFPKTNSKGVIAGALTSLVVISWIDFNAHYYGVSSFYKLPTNVENCTSFENSTNIRRNITHMPHNTPMKFEDIFILYRLSHLYYCLFGTIVTVVVGNIVSYLTGPKKWNDVDPQLIAPFLRKYIKKAQTQEIEMYS